MLPLTVERTFLLVSQCRFRPKAPRLMEARPSSEAGMDLTNERLHAAAQSGDLEQLQVTWSDQVIPRRAADARSSGRAAFAAAVVGNGGRAHAPRRVRHSTRPCPPVEHALRGQLPLRSTGTRHTHWLVVVSTPALRRIYHAQQATVGALSGKGGRRSRWQQWPIIRQWSRF